MYLLNSRLISYMVLHISINTSTSIHPSTFPNQKQEGFVLKISTSEVPYQTGHLILYSSILPNLSPICPSPLAEFWERLSSCLILTATKASEMDFPSLRCHPILINFLHLAEVVILKFKCYENV